MFFFLHCLTEKIKIIFVILRAIWNQYSHSVILKLNIFSIVEYCTLILWIQWFTKDTNINIKKTFKIHLYVVNFKIWDIFTDLNECASKNNCTQKCSNAIGTYTCSCFEGYTLGGDGFTCTGRPPKYGHHN